MQLATHFLHALTNLSFPFLGLHATANQARASHEDVKTPRGLFTFFSPLCLFIILSVHSVPELNFLSIVIAKLLYHLTAGV